MKRITSIEELKNEALYNEKEIAEFFILLNGGLRSSKRIIYYSDTNTFDVYNEIDDSFQDDLSIEQLENETHIVLAIKNRALFKYLY
jgi:hypothetical protein